MRKYKQDPLWAKIASRLESDMDGHMKEDAAYFEKGIAHHQDVAKKLREEIAKADGNNEELKLELMDRLEDTMGDIARMEKELDERKVTAEAIEPSMKGAPSMGKTAPVVEKGDVAKPQPRYVLKNKAPGKPLGKEAADTLALAIEDKRRHLLKAMNAPGINKNSPDYLAMKAEYDSLLPKAEAPEADMTQWGPA